MMLFAVLGGFVGWALAVLVPGGEQRFNIVAGVVTGVAGALLSGWLLVPLLHTSAANVNGIGTTASLVSVLGAALSFSLASLARYGISR